MTRFPAREALGPRLQRRLGSALCCLVAEATGRPPDYLDDLLVIHSGSPANAGVRTSCTSAFVRCGRTRIPRPGRSSNALDRLVMRASRRLDPAAFGAGLRWSGRRTCSREHHHVDRPPTVPYTIWAPSRGQVPPDLRAAITSPVCAPPGRRRTPGPTSARGRGD